MKGMVIAHSVVIATVVAFGAVVGLDIYNGVPTLGGDPMYLTKVVMFLAVMNLALWIGSLFDSLTVKRRDKSLKLAEATITKLEDTLLERTAFLRKVTEEMNQWKSLYLMRIKVNGQTVVRKKDTTVPKEKIEKFWKRKSNHAKWEDFASKRKGQTK